MITVKDIKDMKGKEKISVLTCYDYSFTKLVDGNVDILLVGDSVGNVVYGFESTKDVTMDMMHNHVKAVKCAREKSLIVADMPYGSDDDERTALENAKKFIEIGADAVKVEGKPEIVKFLVDNKINVMGHVGLLPQTAENFETKGMNAKEAMEIKNQALELEKAGAFSIVIEKVDSKLAGSITKSLKIPTIGIGAGKDCDGQVLVLYDVLGLFKDFEPKFVRRYAGLDHTIKDAVKRYSKEVKKEEFPSDNESY